MPQATIAPDGQVTLPQEVLDALGVRPGDQVELVIRSPGEVVLQPTVSVRTLKGILYKPGQRPLSIEEMNQVIGTADHT